MLSCTQENSEEENFQKNINNNFACLVNLGMAPGDFQEVHRGHTSVGYLNENIQINLFTLNFKCYWNIYLIKNTLKTCARTWRTQ